MASPNTQESIALLESSIRTLVNERRTLQERLMSDRRRRPPGSTTLRHDTTTGFRNAKRTLPTQNDTTVLQPDAKSKEIKTNATAAEADPFPVEKRPKLELDDSTIKRTKNIFGSLLGHLQKAKTQLDVEKTQRPAELQRVANEQVDHMLELEKKNLAELRRRDFQERQQRDITRIREVQKELREKENKILQFCLNKHYVSMKNFIQTKASPPIFWLPLHHNEKTTSLIEETANEIQRILDGLEEKFANMEEEKWTSSTQELEKFSSPQPPVTTFENMPAAQQDDIIGTKTMVHPDLIDDDDDDDDEDTVDENKSQPILSNPPECNTHMRTEDDSSQEKNFLVSSTPSIYIDEE